MRVRWAAAALGLVLGVVAVAGGCRRSGEYSQKTPDDTVRSAVMMVRRGETRRLDDLIYAEDERMRAALTRLGDLLGRMQELAVAVHERFPEEVAALRTKAEEAVEDGRAGELVISLGGGGARAGARSGGDIEGRMQGMFTAILADPYGWLDRNAERLGTMPVSDEFASLTLDNKPVLQPIGVPLRLDGGKWYFALPMNLPGVSRAMPQSDAEWRIIGYAMRTLDQAVRELTEDVRGGRVGNIRSLQDRLGEKLVGPGIMVFAAYSREMDVRRRRERLQRQFDKRQREWVKAREDAGRSPPAALREAVTKVVPDQLDALARKDERPNIETMGEAEYAGFLEGLLAGGGLTVVLADAEESQVREALDSWEAARTAAKQKKRRAPAR